MPATHVIMCQRRFVPQIVAGTKLHTIRAQRRRQIYQGDQLDLREWTGRPYRSPQRKIAVVPCVAAPQIEVDARRRRIFLFTPSHYYPEGGYIMDEIAFAQRDGFIYTDDFFQFFRDHHAGLCIGQLIEWNPFS